MGTKRIVVKNSDKLTSLIHKRKIIDEYIVYLLDDDTLMSAEVVYSEVDKNKMVGNLLREYCDGDFNAVSDVSFQEFKDQFD